MFNSFITDVKLELFYLFIVNDFTQRTLWESPDKTIINHSTNQSITEINYNDC